MRSSATASKSRFPVKVGCCGFPIKRSRYANLFPVVEVQMTFYQPPEPDILKRWRAEVPEDFEFTVKAWQLVTHPFNRITYQRLRRPLTDAERSQCGFFRESAIVREGWETTRRCADILAARRILFQCPAKFTPTEEHIANFRSFLKGLERGHLELLWEPRGHWPPGQVKSICDELNVVHVVDPFLCAPVTAGLRYYRLHGGQGYQHQFTNAELRKLLAWLPTNQPAYVLFNNRTMIDDAMRFQEMTARPLNRPPNTPAARSSEGILDRNKRRSEARPENPPPG